MQSRGYSQSYEHLRRVSDAEYGVFIVVMFSVNFHSFKLISFFLCVGGWGVGGVWQVVLFFVLGLLLSWFVDVISVCFCFL